jgi:LysR family transcriptional regulator for bpeEF and oprC
VDRFLALRVFTTVVDKGSFVGAAKALEMSPASVTEHVQGLERHLNTRLLNRTTRRLALTDEGSAYFEHARQILTRMEEADSMLAAQRLNPRGLLRVQMPHMLATQIILPRVPMLLARYTEMRVEISLSASTPDLVHDNLDLALVISMDPDPTVVFRPLGLVRVRTCASPEYLARRGVPRHPDELRDHDTIGVRAGVVLSNYRFEQDGRLITRDFPSRVVADSGDGQLVLGLSHAGIFQAAHYAVAPLLESGRLVQVLEDWSWRGPPLGAMHLPNRFLSPKVQVFLDFARESLGDRVSPYRSDWDIR